MSRRWHRWELRITLGLIVLLMPVMLLPSQPQAAASGAKERTGAVRVSCPPRDPVCWPG